MTRPQGRKSLNVSCVTRSQCLAVSMSHQVSGLRSQVSPPFTPCFAARSARHRRSGNRRADMRPETRDLLGDMRHEPRDLAGGAYTR